MSLPLIDLESLPCKRTQAAISAVSIARGMTTDSVIMDVLSEWAEAKIHASNILLDVLAGAGARKTPHPPLERDVEDDFCARLGKSGIAYRRQVKTASGTADIVLDDIVIEVKRVVASPSALAQAHGQALMYARLLGKSGAVVLAAVVKSKTADPSIRLVCGDESIQRFIEEVLCHA